MGIGDWAKRLWRDLRSQILLWIVLPVATIMLVLSLTGIYSHQQAMRALVEERDLTLATVAAAGIDEGLARCQSVLETVRDDGALHHAKPADYPLVFEELSPQLGVFDEGAAFVATDGELLAAKPDTQVWAARTEALKRYLEQVTPGEISPFLTTFEDPISGGPLAALIVPGVDQRGALVGAFSLEGCGIAATLADLTVGSEGAAYLVDGQGIILYPLDRGQLESNAFTHLRTDGTLIAEAGAGLHQDFAGQPMVVAHAPLGQGGWVVLVQEPWGELIAPMMRYSQITPIVVLLVALGAFTTIFLGVRWVLQPLEELRRRASKIAGGDFSAVDDPVGGIAEIEDLRDTLNQMAERIRAYQSAMHSYMAAVTQAQEEERLRLGHELHDDTVQSLVVLSQGLERAQRELAAAPEGLAEQLAELRELTNTTIDDLRRYISDLRPVYLEDLGLIPALEKLVDDLALGQDIQAEFRAVGTAHRLPANVELAIFRIVQEALTNVEQHAQASWVEVKLALDPDGVTVLVEDDGIGFEISQTPSELSERGHFGLMGMQERAMLLGGWVSIESEPGHGTRILTYLPS
jgi:signal transduction histidine kinase